MTDVYDLDERTRIVAKDILVGSKLVNHPNYTYIPSKQLESIMSDVEIARTLSHLKRLGALDFDDRYMFLGNRIEPQSSYALRTNPNTLQHIAYPIDLSQFKEITSTDNETIRYDASSKLLSVGNKSVKIQGEMLANLCHTILNSADISRVWSNDEILEDWQWPESKIYDEDYKFRAENRVKIYQKAKTINDKVALLTKGKINNLLDYTTKTVAVNKQYRKMLANI